MTDPGPNPPAAAPEGAPEAPQDPDSEALQGVVERVTYRHPDSSYTVLRLAPERGFEDPEELFGGLATRVTAVGNASEELGEGQRLRLEGTWTQHPKHGRQFRFTLARSLPPLDEEGLVRYLSSAAFKGVGPTLAKRIVEVLGTGALQKIHEDPQVLSGIRGLSPGVRVDLVERIRAQMGSRELHTFLFGLGLGPWQVEAVAKKLGPGAEELIRAQPYRLARGIRGIGFALADRVARKLGWGEDSPERRAAGLLFALERAGGEGHTLVPEADLAARAAELLGGPEEVARFAEPLESLETDGELVLEHGHFQDQRTAALPRFQVAESRLARNLAHLLRTAPVPAWTDDERLQRAARAAGLELHADQAHAVRGLLAEPVALLTGGPGVGKTTIVRLVVSLAEAAGARVALASPTGRAAKRLGEATHREAKTVHRLLGWDPAAGTFQHHDKTPLEADLVVVDEISMLDVVLAHHLVKAVQPPARLILVGDPDQLPSVSAGNVLADLLKSECVPVFRLTRIFRQEHDSLIVANAHRILAGETPHVPAPGAEGGDFFFFPADDDATAARRLVEVVTERIPRRFGLDWVEDVQVLAPMYRGACGVDHLNERLREALGLGGRQLEWRDRVWREGDRVIQTRNDYERQVFNGDMGRVVEVRDSPAGLVVRYPDRRVEYRAEDLTDLQPAFAITVHRSQGGEYPAVVIPLVTQHFTMLQRNLLYTAVTRAKKLLVLVGSRRALQRAVENTRESDRLSALDVRLRQALEPDA